MAKERKAKDEIHALDISYSADLTEVAEEVARTRRPTILKKGDTEIAKVIPTSTLPPAKKIDPDELVAAFEALGKTMSGVDPDDLIADIHRAREEGSRLLGR
jgi:hypothetical protein